MNNKDIINDIDLPVSFRLLQSIKTSQKSEKSLFFFIEKYEGIGQTEPLLKPISKICNFSNFTKS